jgi:radical SAM-linked protein
MARILFEKTGNAVWISHLDLMRLFQRAFKRAGLPLKHTQGFNPRPSVSIALPLSVGVESHCELLDFELDGTAVSCGEIQQKLNDALVEGVRVLQVYEEGRKLRDLALLACTVLLEYDAGTDTATVEELQNLFRREALLVTKRSKNGPVEQGIIPLLRSLVVRTVDRTTVALDAVVCCQNPSLNPMQLVAAIEAYLPHRKPDHAICIRREILDTNEIIFR